MRNFLIFVMFAVPFAVLAQTTDTATITLQGTVEKRVAITTTGINNFDDLNLETVVNDLAVVTVNEFSNVREGYTVTLQSANAASLATANPAFVGQNGGETLEYIVTYDGLPVSFVSGSAQVTDSVSKTPVTGVDKSVNISYDGTSSNLVSDTYSDDLTFTITAK
jgi:hypothetical protein